MTFVASLYIWLLSVCLGCLLPKVVMKYAAWCYNYLHIVSLVHFQDIWWLLSWSNISQSINNQFTYKHKRGKRYNYVLAISFFAKYMFMYVARYNQSCYVRTVEVMLGPLRLCLDRWGYVRTIEVMFGPLKLC